MLDNRFTTISNPIDPIYNITHDIYTGYINVSSLIMSYRKHKNVLKRRHMSAWQRLKHTRLSIDELSEALPNIEFVIKIERSWFIHPDLLDNFMRWLDSDYATQLDTYYETLNAQLHSMYVKIISMINMNRDITYTSEWL